MSFSASVAPVSTENKTTAIVSYLTLIGFVVAVGRHGARKTRLGAFHLRQMLGVMAASFVLWFAGTLLMFIPLVGWMAGLAAWFGIFALWALGFIAALNGELRPVPLLGERFQKWFGSAFD